ncbi:tagaturonate reductase [Mucilaginibacter sp. E4BP6]|uniref:tagaturonate reductase n=1 Tax=Mucilaginibacter sp. E4BP6 TaxID=2723089 RepID=UPI0015CB025E|nr:tagaturonate reductase [Mucilaginibacter sp. E4BP6]NYE65748.1 tagaturonate reductase [Mucilaginibacter sp. E4BP6]
MILSKNNLKNIHVSGLQIPGEQIFDLPEKVLQFGTGVLLRGLPDYFIDKANKQGIFNGRVVVIKSTYTGSSSDFDKQDGLYTIYSKGIENGVEVEESTICSSISRVLSAANEWEAILDVAKSPDLQVIISNTTEVGIQLVKEEITDNTPASYPGKLLAILHERYTTFNGSAESGLIIIPTELIVDNGKKLEAIVIELAHLNNFEFEFIDWLENHNTFCNSLVDRIVPGKPAKELATDLENKRGYTDDLNIMSETYSLWAIEGDEKVAAVLSFAKVDKGVVITPDIQLFRELKLRLLNGSHTLSCAVAFLSGFDTVKEAMDDDKFLQFINGLAYDEIIQSIPYEIAPQIAKDFAGKVLDRFRNPHIRHEWLSISVQYSAKLKMRVVPLLLNYYKLNNSVPANMALGFAAFIRFMKVKRKTDGTYVGSINGREYSVTDTQASYFSKVWKAQDTDLIVNNILSNQQLWDTDLTALPGFKQAVINNLNTLLTYGITELTAV